MTATRQDLAIEHDRANESAAPQTAGHALVVVVDTNQARFLSRDSSGGPLVEHPADQIARRTQRSGGAFLKAVAQRTDALLWRPGYDRLILCAPFLLLGGLRASLTDRSRERLALSLGLADITTVRTAADLDSRLRGLQV